MNLFTNTIKVTKIDYYGQPYEATIVNPNRRNLGDLWQKFTAMQKEQPVIDHTGQSGGVSEAWYEREILKEEIKNNTI